jgi:flagellar basal-body rod protein FlgG
VLKGIAAAASGMLPRVTKQEAIANNLANSSTAGFKRDRVFLEDLSRAQSKMMKGEADWQIPPRAVSAIDFSQGTMQRTDHALDFGIVGDGFFVASTPEGERYTRNGHFAMSASGVLTTSDGKPILGTDGQLQIPAGAITVSETGIISVDGRKVGSLKIVRFSDPNVLVRAGSSLLAVGAPGVTAQNDETSSVRQGFLESSNVSTIEEMVDMITTFRHFETGQKAIQMQDETLGKAVNELGRVPA